MFKINKLAATIKDCYQALAVAACGGDPDLKTAYVTLSGSGRFVSLPWLRPGHKLNY